MEPTKISLIEPSVSLVEDLSMFMKDKAISPPMTHWDSFFNKGAMFYLPPFHEGSRRLVETVLNDEHIEPQECLEYVQSGSSIGILFIACPIYSRSVRPILMEEWKDDS